MHGKSPERPLQTHTTIFELNAEISFRLHFYVITHPGEQQQQQQNDGNNGATSSKAKQNASKPRSEIDKNGVDDLVASVGDVFVSAHSTFSISLTCGCCANNERKNVC